jgi:predicted RNase H-like nuclease
MSWVAGADGYKGQWCVVLQELETGDLRACVVPDFAGLIELPERPAVVAVDIPIGLPDITPPGGRNCEQEARRLLGPRASSVFSAVGRIALGEASRLQAHHRSRADGGIGVGAQAWGLAAKLKEADRAMTPERQGLIYEVHPEVSFWALNGQAVMPFSKKSPEGEAHRISALTDGGFPSAFCPKASRESPSRTG